MESYLRAEISASAVLHNLALLRRHVPPAVRICAVVKADCYGHGVRELLPLLGREADVIGVATPHEALLYRELGHERPILMFFSACAHSDGKELHELLEELIRRQVILTVVAPVEVAVVQAAAAKVGAQARVHVKIDTGMGRSGIAAEKAPALFAQVRQARGVQLLGAYTHFATADEADKAFAREQLQRFRTAIAAAGGPSGLCLHAANSAGTIDLPESHMDMVRPGIALYGYQPSDDMHVRLPLRPVLRLTGRLMQRKLLPAGSGCGYGLAHRFDRETPAGLVPVGYADGYMRCLSGRATMRIRGRDVPVCGRVAMDQVIVDLSAVPDAAVGDEVEIMSADPAAPHSVENLARLAGTIPYEITCRLGRRAKRVLVD